jgi:hypothetical protein
LANTPVAGEATVHIKSGCVGPDYYLESWEANSDIQAKAFPQTLYDVASSAPFVVNLPACYWQVDFVWRNLPPADRSPTTKVVYTYAAELGGISCGNGGVTTTTTTVAPTTTTTTVAPTTTTSTTSTTTTSTTTTSTTSTTLGPTTTSTTSTPPTTVATGPGGGTTTTTVGNSTGGGTTTTSTTVPAGQATSGQPGGGKLAFTGFDFWTVLMVGILALLVGFAALATDGLFGTPEGPPAS